MKSALGIIATTCEHPVTICYSSPLGWCPSSTVEIASALKLFGFTDASHGGTVEYESIECFVLILGETQSRSDTILCKGGLLDAGAKKIMRIRRSSLGAESVALCNCADIDCWARILLLEMTLGTVFSELINDKSSSYALITPFGSPPGASTVLSEIAGVSSKPMVAVQNSNELNEKLFGMSSKRCILENWIKTLILTDSANAYSSILCGNPHTLERQTRLTLSVVRDMGHLIVLSFIDKDFNLPDAGTKHEHANTKILSTFLKTGFPALGFWFLLLLFRRNGRLGLVMKKMDPCKSSNIFIDGNIFELLLLRIIVFLECIMVISPAYLSSYHLYNLLHF